MSTPCPLGYFCASYLGHPLQDALDAATRHATTGDLALLLARKRNLVAQRLLYVAAGVVAAATFVLSGGASGVLLTGALLAARAVAGRFKGPNGEAFHLRLVCAADPAVPAAERTTLLFATGFRTEDGAGARAGAGAAAKREADEHFRKQLRGILDCWGACEGRAGLGFWATCGTRGVLGCWGACGVIG